MQESGFYTRSQCTHSNDGSMALAIILMSPNGGDNIQDECSSIFKQGKFFKER